MSLSVHCVMMLGGGGDLVSAVAKEEKRSNVEVKEQRHDIEE